MNNTQIKRLATIRLSGNWGNCIALGVTMLSMGLLVILGEILIYNGFSYLYPDENYYTFLASPVGLSLITCRVIAYYLIFVPEINYMRTIYASLSAGESFIGVRWALRHIGIKYYIKAIFVQTISILYHVVLLAPFAISVYVVTYYIGEAREQMNNTNLIMFMLSLLTSILFLFLYIFLTIKIRLVPFILAAKNDLKIFDAFMLSARLMEGNVLRYILFILSFVKYFLLCLLIFPIIVVLPYYNMSIAIFCRSLVTDEKISEYLAEKEKKA